MPTTQRILPKNIIRPFANPDATCRLYCFPHAGSGASFYHFLAKEMRKAPIEIMLVQYPGRESRMTETAAISMEALVKDFLKECVDLLKDKPFVFFGHSMGALLSFEITHALSQSGDQPPECLLISARQSPDVTKADLHVDELTDDEFIQAVGKKYNAIPDVLFENKDLLQLIIPSLRADFSLMYHYEYRERRLLNIPALTLNGINDPWISKEGLEGWQKHFIPKVHHQSFKGDHFYLNKKINKFIECLLNFINKTNSDHQ